MLHPSVLMGLLCLLVACDFSDTKKTSAEAILQSPPFATVTDSIRRFPSDATLFARRALLLSQHDHHELATSDYLRAYELQPEEPMALQYVNNLLLVNRHRDAISFLKQCLQTWPGNIDMHRRLSEIYEQTGQTAKAVQQYDELLRHDSLDFEAWYNKGILLSQLKDTAGAIQALERSFAIQPVYFNGATLAGYYAHALDPRTPALCDQLIAKDVAGELPDAHFIKGLYYSYTQQYDSAMAQFNEALRRDWRFADAHIEKGIIQFEQKQYDAALQTFTTAANVVNTNPDAYYWMGRCYEETGNKELALINYERALALDRTFDEAREGLRRVRS